MEYIEEIKSKNPESVCSCITQSPEGAPLFKRIFISFKSTVTGFLSGCRPCIGVDGCFLKGSFAGVLLVALGLGNDNGYFSIVDAVV